MEEIQTNEYNLNLTRYISTAKPEEKIDLRKVHSELVNIENNIVEATNKHNEFLKELGLKQLPLGGKR